MWVDGFLCLLISFILADMFLGYPVKKMLWRRRRKPTQRWPRYERVKINDVQISLLSILTSALPPLHLFPPRSTTTRKQASQALSCVFVHISDRGDGRGRGGSSSAEGSLWVRLQTGGALTTNDAHFTQTPSCTPAAVVRG